MALTHITRYAHSLCVKKKLYYKMQKISARIYSGQINFLLATPAIDGHPLYSLGQNQ